MKLKFLIPLSIQDISVHVNQVNKKSPFPHQSQAHSSFLCNNSALHKAIFFSFYFPFHTFSFLLSQPFCFISTLFLPFPDPFLRWSISLHQVVLQYGFFYYSFMQFHQLYYIGSITIIIIIITQITEAQYFKVIKHHVLCLWVLGFMMKLTHCTNPLLALLSMFSSTVNFMADLTLNTLNTVGNLQIVSCPGT